MNAVNEFATMQPIVPPHSIDAEQMVLGALMLDNNAIDRIDALRQEHFYRADHRMIFATITGMIAAGKPADVLTVYEALNAAGSAEEAGGLPYLNTLAQNTPGAANIRHYAEIVTERWQRRELLEATNRIAAMLERPRGLMSAEIAAQAQSLFEPVTLGQSREPLAPGDVLLEIVQEISRQEEGGEPRVTPTGLTAIDEKLGGGVHGSELIVAAGRPSMGKTAFALCIAGNVAQAGKPVLFFSMEMSARALHQRNIARIGSIPLGKVLNGASFNGNEDEDWARFTHAVSVLNDMPLYIDETPSLTLAQIVARSRAMKRKHGLGLIVVDYLGLMTGATEERQDLRIGSYSAGLKALAKRLDVPVLVLAQLNRSVEQRPNKRPGMADLRDSGAIEQDADVVMMLYRDEFYDPDSADRGTAEVIVAKQRNGETGPVRLAFSGVHQRFADLEPGYRPVPVPKRAPERSRRGFD